jgi:hypothetical protein
VAKPLGARKHIPNNNSQSGEVLEGYKKEVEDLQKQKAATLVSDAKTQKVKRDLNIGILKTNMHSWSDSKFFANTSSAGDSNRNIPSKENEDCENSSHDFTAAVHQRIKQEDHDIYTQISKTRNTDHDSSYSLPVLRRLGQSAQSNPLAYLKQEYFK